MRGLNGRSRDALFQIHIQESMEKQNLEYVGILDANGELLLVSDCNSQVDADSYDGPVLWPDLESAQSQEEDFGGCRSEGCRFVKVTLTIEDISTTP